MSFSERLLRKRRLDLADIPGFSGGNLQDQLDPQMDQPQQPTGQMLTPQNQAAITRPRQVMPVQSDQQQPATSPFTDRLMRPRTVFQEGESQTRDRRTQPQDVVADHAQYLSDIENRPLSLRDKAGLVAQAISTNLGGKPLPTRRQMETQRATGGLQRDIAVDRESAQKNALKSQQDAREAAMLAGQDRIRQGDERLRQGDERLASGAVAARKRNLASVYNGQREFNPDDPKNAAMVAQFQQEFGFPPPKKVSGSLLQVVEGQNPDGSPSFTVIDKGTQTASQVQGDLPAQTTNQVNREQRQQQFNTAEAGRNRRAITAEFGRTARAAGNTGGRSSGQTPAQSAAQLRAANTLVARYNQARKLEMSLQIPAKDKIGLKASREALWQQAMDTYPGMFEADDKGELRMKSQQAAPTAPALKGRTISQQNFDKYKADHGDAAAQQLLDGGVTIRK